MERRIKDLTEREFATLMEEVLRKTMEEISEDFIALSSRKYIESIEEARRDYREGRVKEFGEVFDV